MVDRIESCAQYFETLEARFIPEKAKGVNCHSTYEHSGEGGGTWTVTVADQTVSTAEGGCEKPKITIMMDAAQYVDMANGDLDGTKAYMTRKLKVKGSIPMAQKMKKFLPPRKA